MNAEEWEAMRDWDREKIPGDLQVAISAPNTNQNYIPELNDDEHNASSGKADPPDPWARLDDEDGPADWE